MNNGKRIVLHASSGREGNSFVGIRITNEEVHFHYPESYELAPLCETRAFRRDVINIIRSISLAEKRSQQYGLTDSGAAAGDRFAIMSNLWLIRDYLSNGYYRSKEKSWCKNGGGRINWKKTLLTQPVVSGGNVIYSDVITEKRNVCDDIVTEIHRYCVFDSVRKIGWLFGMSERSVFAPRITDAVLKKYIKTVQAEFMRTFDDGKKLRLNHMLRVLLNVDDSEQKKDIVYGVDKYQYIYERMINKMFGNVVDISRFDPSASWFLKKNGYTPRRSSALRPDTIRLEPLKSADGLGSRAAYIIDAKYYRFGVTGSESDLPSTESVQKQLTYGDNIICNLSSRENIQKVYNAFILPYNRKKNVFGYSGELEYMGFVKAGWRQDKMAHTKICAFLIDTRYLVENWDRGSNDDGAAKLICEIERMASL